MIPARSLPLLQPGNGKPIFMAHGMGGTVSEFFRLIKFIETSQPIFGLEAKGNNGGDEPFTRIQDLAQFHLDAIMGVQSQGPFFLIGYSLGGLVALEIAQRLLSKGETVGLLAMIDSYPHPSRLQSSQRIQLGARRAKQRALQMISSETNPKLGGELSASMQRSYDSAQEAWENYQPNFYHGKIGFVKAETATIYPDNPAAVWNRLAQKIEVESVPGDHHEILTKNFEILGSVISRYIASALKAAR